MNAEDFSASRKFKIAVVTTLGAISVFILAYLLRDERYIALYFIKSGDEFSSYLPGLTFGFVVSIALIICLKSKTSVVTARAVLSYFITVTAWVAAWFAGFIGAMIAGLPISAVIYFKGILNGLNISQFDIIIHIINLTLVFLIGGFFAGSVGAATLFRGCALMVPALRRHRIWRPSVAIGAITGVFVWLAFGFIKSTGNAFLVILFIFLPWKMAFAFWLGYALTAPSESENSPISVSDRNKDGQILN